MKLSPQMYYFETKSVRPTKEDSDNSEYVLAWNGESWYKTYWRHLLLNPDSDDDLANYYTHWMQLPKAPNPNDQHAFLE